VSHTAISSALNKGGPGAQLCVAIADAVGVPVAAVMQRTGVLPPDPPRTATWRRLSKMWARLSDEDQERIFAQLPVQQKRIVQVDIHDLGQSQAFRMSQDPGDLIGSYYAVQRLGLPGTDAQKVGWIGRVGCFDELALKGRQGLLIFANQRRIDQVENLLTLWSRQVDLQEIEKRAQLWTIVFNTRVSMRQTTVGTGSWLLGHSTQEVSRIQPIHFRQSTNGYHNHAWASSA